MQYRPVGQSGIQASIVALGSWAMGGWMWGGTEEARSIKAIHAALDAGVNFIDTAPIYGMGISEEIVGKALAGRRGKAVVATKCGLVWHVRKGSHFFDQDGKPVYRCLDPESIRYEIEESLRRLRTDYIDLYQTHWQDPTTPIEDTVGALLDLKRQGKIRAIGVSNCALDLLEKYRNVGPVDSLQERYSMIDRALDAEILPYCLRNNIAVLAYSPLAYGLLTGKVGSERKFPAGDLRRQSRRYSPEGLRQANAMLDEIRPFARKHGVELSHIVIAWTVAQPGLTHALVGCRDERQSRENSAAGSVTLDATEIEEISKIIARYTLPAEVSAVARKA